MLSPSTAARLRSAAHIVAVAPQSAPASIRTAYALTRNGSNVPEKGIGSAVGSGITATLTEAAAKPVKHLVQKDLKSAKHTIFGSGLRLHSTSTTTNGRIKMVSAPFASNRKPQQIAGEYAC